VDEKMEGLILLDSSVLIEYFRKKDKSQTFFFKLSKQYEGFAIPVTVHFEIMAGSNRIQDKFWENLFNDFLIIPYTVPVNYQAREIRWSLMKKRKSIVFKDLLIAATALNFNLVLATLNKKHYSDIENIILITPSSPF